MSTQSSTDNTTRSPHLRMLLRFRSSEYFFSNTCTMRAVPSSFLRMVSNCDTLRRRRLISAAAANLGFEEFEAPP